MSRLYNTRQLCCFCAQMVAPENVAAATGAAGGSEEGNVESALWPAAPREYPPLHCSEWKAEVRALAVLGLDALAEPTEFTIAAIWQCHRPEDKTLNYICQAFDLKRYGPHSVGVG